MVPARTHAGYYPSSTTGGKLAGIHKIKDSLNALPWNARFRALLNFASNCGVCRGHEIPPSRGPSSRCGLPRLALFCAPLNMHGLHLGESSGTPSSIPLVQRAEVAHGYLPVGGRVPAKLVAELPHFRLFVDAEEFDVSHVREILQVLHRQRLAKTSVMRATRIDPPRAD